MNSNNYSKPGVSFYPKYIIANLSYDVDLVTEIMYELDLNIKQEHLIDQVINITFTVNHFNIKAEINKLVMTNISTEIVDTYKHDIVILLNILMAISSKAARTFIHLFKDAHLYSKYINWSTGDLIVSSTKLNEDVIRNFSRICDN